MVKNSVQRGTIKKETLVNFLKKNRICVIISPRPNLINVYDAIIGFFDGCQIFNSANLIFPVEY